MRIASAVVLGACLALAAPSRAEDPVALNWKLKEGETLYARSVADMDMTMTIMGMDVDLKMKITTVQKFKVLEVKPDATKLEMTILSMSMDVGGIPGGIPGLSDLGKNAKGATITATLNKDMEVTKVEGYDKFLDKLAGGDEDTRKAMKGQMTESAVGQMVSQVFSFTPKQAVKVGETWTQTTKMPAAGLGDATVKQKYKLVSVTDGIAKIALEGDMTFKPGDAAIPNLPPGVKISKLDMKADKFTGTILFDTKANRLKETTQNMAINGSITLSAGGADVEMKMKIKGTQTATITDKNPIKD